MPPISNDIRLLFVGDHLADGGLIGAVGISAAAQATTALGVLLGEDVALESVRSLDLAGLRQIEALLGAAVGLQFRHNITPSIYSPAGAGRTRVLFSGLLGLGGQEHGHDPALHLGGLIHGGHVGAKLRELLQQIPADIRMRHLAAGRRPSPGCRQPGTSAHFSAWC